MPPKTIRILVVEDDEPKLTSVADFLRSGYPDCEITTARSLSSGMNALDNGRFDLAILDMSLPTYDLARDKAGGGEPQGYGGRDLLRSLEAESPTTRAIVFTQHPAFSDASSGARTLEELGEELRQEFGGLLLGIVFYSGKQGRWRVELPALIDAFWTAS